MICLFGTSLSQIDVNYDLSLSQHLNNFVAVGDASLDTTEILLAGAFPQSKGSVYLTQPVVFLPNSEISTYFSFFMDQGSHDAADGFDFIINRDPSPRVMTFSEFANYHAFKVNFRTYKNVEGARLSVEKKECSGTQLSNTPQLCAPVSGPVYQLSNDFIGLVRQHVWIDYDLSSSNLEIRMSQDGVRPTNPIATYNFDISFLYGETIYFGVRALSISQFARHRLLGTFKLRYDVNECLTNNGGCSSDATCTNTIGSRTCTCNSGYSGDGVSCADINECSTNNGGCSSNAECQNTIGSSACFCNQGFSGDGIICSPLPCNSDSGFPTTQSDVVSSLYNCPQNHYGNTLRYCYLGVWSSITNDCKPCSPGYVSPPNSRCCYDLNECLTNNGGCSSNATCTNTAGSRTCTCKSGFTGNGVSCADINECSANNGGCSSNATCTNTIGSRTCTCKNGFTGNGTSCVDRNECLTNNGGCSSNATCTNTIGSRTCTCKSGFTGNGVTCADKNECSTNNGGCSSNATCTNTIGSRTCACKPGFTGNGLVCTPI